ncbi:type II toxin-antitoxin system VapC family toxin [Acetobacter tropicalis]|uniref:PIN domain-containing protein n=1 Tax=Acetobacter tropicalis TaxID=104102 RepID=UPI00068B21B1|nr:PIN domain-containing protein [Acetobacter tropicalis]KAA8391307.1 type II toxin-antitoxin system VapC family toxin [Acetobacter tropicalis]KAA8391561.1 type II toxin-antitoxin system VapC family toxin [Acetobacter tropicalis]MBC9007837.1 PIN domain-containing protein [Acetobacter tropicalis]
MITPAVLSRCLLDRNSDKLFISVITIAEIEAGIAKLKDNGSLKKAQRLYEWLETLLHLYQHRVLPLDIQLARELGRMTQAVRQAGRMPEMADLSIAATAIVRGYVMLTRNLRYFQGTGVTALDPFESLPTQG